MVREDTGEGNGCTFDRQGRLLMCEGADRRRVTCMEADGTITSIAERWEGKRFNKPNDVICRTDGTIYFTDPHLRLPEAEREYDFAGVFRIAPDSQITVATDGCEYPNGLAFSPDESVLYVAISRESQVCFEEQEKGLVCEHRKIRVFDVAAGGTLSNNRVFASMASAEAGVPDGMKVDSQGRVYCTGSEGCWVFDSSGNHLGIIRPPEIPANCAWGGPDHRTMFFTARTSVYTMRMTTPGTRIPMA